MIRQQPEVHDTFAPTEQKSVMTVGCTSKNVCRGTAIPPINLDESEMISPLQIRIFLVMLSISYANILTWM